MADFAGFPAETQKFLKSLSKNNTKDWFDAHRSDYEDYWVAPAKAFVDAAGDALQELAPVAAEPKVNGSIFRINRDIRFSADKTPYKDHLDFWFWEGERKTAVSGFYLRITPEAVGVGVGAHSFDKDRLAQYRAAVVDDAAGKALKKAVAVLKAARVDVKGEHYKSLPRGFEAADEFEEKYLRYNALWTGEDEPAPASLTSKRFVGWAMTRWSKQAPLHRWLVRHVS